MMKKTIKKKKIFVNELLSDYVATKSTDWDLSFQVATIIKEEFTFLESLKVEWLIAAGNSSLAIASFRYILMVIDL